MKKVEDFFHIENLADPRTWRSSITSSTALRANYLMFRDKDYVVKDDEVSVDEFTGRIMPDAVIPMVSIRRLRRRSTYMCAVRARTLATITFQNFFNKFNKKAGMTGTADRGEGVP